MPTAARQTEAGFQKTVMAAARLHGWRCVHYSPVKVVRRGGAAHFTPAVGDRGGPDLLLAKDGKVWCLELKSDVGRLSAEQRAWAQALGDCYWVVRPRDWDRLLAVLQGGT